MRRTRSGRTDAFTLVEMLVVLAMLALVASLSLPLLCPPSDKLVLEDIARKMTGALRLARAQAIGSNAPVTVWFDTQRHLYDPPGGASVVLPPAITMHLTVAENARAAQGRGGFRFSPDGGSSGGELLLELGQRKERILVNWLTGAARLE